MAPTIKQLTHRNKIHKEFADHWRVLDAMVKGGSAMTADIKSLLLANPDNSQKDTYNERIRLAPYDSVVGVIIMRLASQLMIDKPSYEGSADDFWSAQFLKKGFLIPDDDDAQASMQQGLTTAVVGALTTGKYIAQVDVRNVEARNAYEQKILGGNNPYVVMRDRWSLWDWESDKYGFKFVKLHDFFEERDGWDGMPIPVHQFTIYQRIESGSIFGSVYQVRLKPNAATPSNQAYSEQFSIAKLCDLTDQNTEIIEVMAPTPIFSTTGGKYAFPVVCLNLPDQLCIADQTYDLQKSYFNHVLGGEWAQLQTNYAQLVFTGIDKPHQEGNDNPAKNMPTGDGRYWELYGEQKAEWLVRDPAGIELSLSYQDKLRSRMMEMINVIAEAASASYATKYQSGDSKREQRRPLDILLEVYGERIRGFATSIINVASVARNENIEWDVKGFTDYHTTGLIETIGEYLKLEEAGIDSPTLKRESQKAIAGQVFKTWSLPSDLLAVVTTELEKDPFNLTDGQRDSLVRLAQYGQIDQRDLFETLKAAGDLPSSFNIEQAIARLSGATVPNTAPPNTVLSNATTGTAITEPAN
jgi:hypothetical protein